MKTYWAIGLAWSLAVPALAQDHKRKPGDETLRDALECVSYLQIAQAAYPMVGMERMMRYWTKRRDQLGKLAKLTPKEINVKQLVVGPLTVERLPGILSGCGEMMPSG